MLLHSSLNIYYLIIPMPVNIEFAIKVNTTETKDICFYFIFLNIKNFLLYKYQII